ncbi:MAG: hypothetical protein ACKV2T_38070 [Kofleriaceae bacterium]
MDPLLGVICDPIAAAAQRGADDDDASGLGLRRRCVAGPPVDRKARSDPDGVELAIGPVVRIQRRRNLRLDFCPVTAVLPEDHRELADKLVSSVSNALPAFALDVGGIGRCTTQLLARTMRKLIGGWGSSRGSRSSAACADQHETQEAARDRGIHPAMILAPALACDSVATSNVIQRCPTSVSTPPHPLCTAPPTIIGLWAQASGHVHFISRLDGAATILYERTPDEVRTEVARLPSTDDRFVAVSGGDIAYALTREGWVWSTRTGTWMPWMQLPLAGVSLWVDAPSDTVFVGGRTDQGYSSARLDNREDLIHRHALFESC